MSPLLRSVARAAVALVLLTGHAAAQISTGGIRGIVKDGSGAVLAGVTVEASSPARIGGAIVEVTNAQGLYAFQNLPVGEYAVVLSLQGFATIRHENIRVEVGRTIQVDASMAVGTVEQSITVVGETPVVDSTNAGFTTNFNSALVERMPVLSRTSTGGYFGVVASAPAVNLQRGIGVSQFNVFGSNSDQNSFQYDGVEVSSVTSGSPQNFPNYDFVQEVQVKAIGASAEYAGFQGGVVNVVSKSGGNHWRGTASAYYQDEHLTGSNTPGERFPFNVEYSHTVSVELGGPIATDRLWVTGVYYFDRQRESQVGVDPTFAPRIVATRPFLKGTWKASSADTIAFSYLDNIFEVPSATSRTMPREVVNNPKGKGPVLIANWTRMLGSATLLDLSGGGLHPRVRNNPLSDNFETARHQDLATGFITGNLLPVFQSNQDANSINAALAHRVDTFLVGSHDVKGGTQIGYNTSAVHTAFVQGALYLDLNGAPFQGVFRGSGVTNGRVRSVGAFVQDTWTVDDRLTLNLGVRTDHIRGDIPAVALRDARVEHETGVTAPGVADLIAFNHVSPRLGLTYRLDSSGKTVAKGGFGRYYGKLTTGMFSALSPGSAITERRSVNRATGQYDTLVSRTDPTANFAVDPDLKNQYTDQIFVGLERQIMPDLGVDLAFMRKKEHDFIRMRNVRGVYEARPLVDTFRGVTQTLPVLHLTSSPSQNLFQVTNREDLDQDYTSVVAQAYKRFSAGWQAQGSYVWSRSRAHGTGVLSPQSQDFGGLGAEGFGADPNDLTNAFGRAATDSTHNVRVTGSYAAPLDVFLSLRYSYESGRPYGRLITVPGLPQEPRTIIAEPRGAYILPALNGFDVNLEKTFQLGGTRRLRLVLDIYNLFNSNTVVTLRNNSTETGDAGFGQSLSVVDPRSAQLGIRFQF